MTPSDRSLDVQLALWLGVALVLLVGLGAVL